MSQHVRYPAKYSQKQLANVHFKEASRLMLHMRDVVANEIYFEQNQDMTSGARQVNDDITLKYETFLAN